jgi:ParB family chromosome partitioning protein
LISPPILYEKPKGFGIVSGFRRIAACRQLGRTSERMRILPGDADAFSRAQLAVAENALQRPLNLIEQSRAYNLLAAALDDSDRLGDVSAAVGLPTHPGLIEKTLPLCRFPESIQKSILAGTVSLAMTVALGRHDPATAVALVQLFENLKLGLNRQREVLGLLVDIARRDDVGVADLLNHAGIQAILSDPSASAAQKRQRLIEHLKRLRFPRMCRKMAEFQAVVNRLPLGRGIALIPSKHFEAGSYTLSVVFSTRQELSDRTARLGELIKDPSLRKLFQ